MMRFSTAILLLATVLTSFGSPAPHFQSQPLQLDSQTPTVLARSRRRSTGGTGRRLILSYQAPVSQSA